MEIANLSCGGEGYFRKFLCLGLNWRYQFVRNNLQAVYIGNLHLMQMDSRVKNPDTPPYILKIFETKVHYLDSIALLTSSLYTIAMCSHVAALSSLYIIETSYPDITRETHSLYSHLTPHINRFVSLLAVFSGSSLISCLCWSYVSNSCLRSLFLQSILTHNPYPSRLRESQITLRKPPSFLASLLNPITTSRNTLIWWYIVDISKFNLMLPRVINLSGTVTRIVRYLHLMCVLIWLMCWGWFHIWLPCSHSPLHPQHPEGANVLP